MKNAIQLSLSTLFFIFSISAIASAQESPDPSSSPPVVNLIMVDYTFGGPESIPSGWATFRMQNKGNETHEFFLHRLSEGKTFEDMRTQVFPPMDSLEQLLLEGKIDSAEHQKALQEAYPKWISKMQAYGGGGLITPDQTSKTTLKLDPGTYVMTCFIGSANGRSHRSQGMVRPMTVTERSSGQSAPEEDVKITSSGTDITMEGTFEAGEQTVALHVEKPPKKMEPYSNTYLVRLDPDMGIDELRDFDANPPPADILGGALGILPGKTGYFTVDLTPGEYVLAFPIIQGQQETQFKEFTVE